ncbi:DUF2188 domain-containing protein [Polymorphobacter fuscus]|uniref:DUF2188 domain-containing protein n=1 Tax=Sandarakinorhabdus fusca TaxID=1439888 RepID=A0A7C9KX42_9SPHN|nr:DUF2188 domain-containing protein [Polymorphobacter fuscus]KAB7649022.1 DUF2188 domain-containing protein [Polymorphobacter fuscus]MQT16626.1 DUF2188 domain-containing protein [Polymorphobacter fuscus]NJC07084.1 hypothetical protein [Polymorphobacter fuscus]
MKIVPPTAKPPAQPITRYSVIRDGSQWRINLAGVNYGYYADAGDATRVAIETAQKAGEAGHATQVLVETLPMQFRIAWTFGDDPGGKDAAPAG